MGDSRNLIGNQKNLGTMSRLKQRKQSREKVEKDGARPETVTITIGCRAADRARNVRRESKRREKAKSISII